MLFSVKLIVAVCLLSSAIIHLTKANKNPRDDTLKDLLRKSRETLLQSKGTRNKRIMRFIFGDDTNYIIEKVFITFLLGLNNLNCYTK